MFDLREENGKTVLMQGEYHNLLSKGKFYTNDIDFIYIHSYIEKTRVEKTEDGQRIHHKVLIPVGYQITLSDKMVLIDLKIANFFTRKQSFREITKEVFLEEIEKARQNFNNRFDEFKNMIKTL